jgi:uncharacterized SAM-binding protein YcdF (DUF218 family)
MTISGAIKELARTLWDYHNITTPLPSHSDFVLAAGSHDERVAFHSAALMLSGLAELLVTSGGYGKVTRSSFRLPEGERFRQIAIEHGVKPEVILVENSASNTGENILLTKRLFLEKQIPVKSGILVTKPYATRRLLAAAQKQWPEISWSVSAPDLMFEEYATEKVPEHRMIELMVGDLQRIKLYADQGFQMPQEIPAPVWKAYEDLVSAGYDRYVLCAQ